MNKYIISAEYGDVAEDYNSVNICVTDTLEDADKIAENLNNFAKTFENLCKKYLKSFNLKNIQDREDLLSFLKEKGAKNKIKYYELLLCFCHDLSVFSSIVFIVQEAKYVAKA